MGKMTVFVGALEKLDGTKLQQVTVAILPGFPRGRVAFLNRLLRGLAAQVDGGLWDKNFGAVRKNYGGKRVNHLRFPGQVPDVEECLRAAGYDVQRLPPPPPKTLAERVGEVLMKDGE